MNDVLEFSEPLTRLADDSGAIGHFLREIPGAVLQRADKTGSPWASMLKIRRTPKQFQKLFRAGQSQSRAWQVLAGHELGVETFEGSLWAEIKSAKANRDVVGLERATAKLLDRYWWFDHGKLLIEAAERRSNAFADCVKSKVDALKKRNFRKHGRNNAQPAKRPVRIQAATQSSRLALHLTLGWLRNGPGGLGYCFFTDKALAEFFEYGWRQSVKMDTLRKVRQSLKLRKAEALVYAVQELEGKVELRARNGTLIQVFRR